MLNIKDTKIKKLNEEELDQVTGGVWKPSIVEKFDLNLLPRTGDTNPASNTKETQFREPGVHKG